MLWLYSSVRRRIGHETRRNRCNQAEGSGGQPETSPVHFSTSVFQFRFCWTCSTILRQQLFRPHISNESRSLCLLIIRSHEF